jgi:hypothetical protein
MDIQQLSNVVGNKVDASEVQDMLHVLQKDATVQATSGQQIHMNRSAYDMLFPICDKLKDDINKKTSLSEVMSLIKSVRGEISSSQEKPVAGNGFASVKCLSCNQSIDQASLLHWASPKNAPPHLKTNKMPPFPSTDPSSSPQGRSLPYNDDHSHRVRSASNNQYQPRAKTAHGTLKPIHPSSRPASVKEMGRSHTPTRQKGETAQNATKKQVVIKEKPKKLKRETTTGKDGKLYFSDAFPSIQTKERTESDGISMWNSPQENGPVELPGSPSNRPNYEYEV